MAEETTSGSPTRVSATIDTTTYRTLLNDGRHTWIADEPTEDGGQDEGPNPYDLLCASLASCTAITLRMYLNRKGWAVSRLHVEVQMATQTENGKTTTQFERTLLIEGEIGDNERQRLLQIANACPVHKVLSGQMSIQTTLA
jgi:putative redox protein